MYIMYNATNDVSDVFPCPGVVDKSPDIFHCLCFNEGNVATGRYKKFQDQIWSNNLIDRLIDRFEELGVLEPPVWTS